MIPCFWTKLVGYHLAQYIALVPDHNRLSRLKFPDHTYLVFVFFSLWQLFMALSRTFLQKIKKYLCLIKGRFMQHKKLAIPNFPCYQILKRMLILKNGPKGAAKGLNGPCLMFLFVRHNCNVLILLHAKKYLNFSCFFCYFFLDSVLIFW